MLGISKTSVTHWRNGRTRPDDLAVIRMARLMHTDPAPIVAELHAERAQDPESRALRLRIAGQLQATVAPRCHE
ncbi:helix-turn-helix transcriptional regulator [Variovorax sp. J22P271]|uniref:helix-turn-helix domain-containing protein n=1 Tax=Variovorax davisae TaxID=3053515 RepID=UPI0025777CD8|nr:helix-turn-helix transcriptional regulator [Variovorax sp. J22P271]MDM0032373.1 helix-turn-helix transcriptional regulator [Variovorax sp. J22P271]